MAWAGMDPLAAANKIRDKVDHDVSSKVNADDQHRLTFVEHVCRHLGLKPTLPAMAHVREVLEHEGLMQVPPQYPKMLTNDEGKPIFDEKGDPIVFESEADEAAHAAKAKEAAKAARADDDKPKKKG